MTQSPSAQALTAEWAKVQAVYDQLMQPAK
jgi:hypothetical protein